MTSKPWFVYLLRCSDGSLYCGVTNNVERRVAKHSSGKGSKYTRSRLPVELAWQSSTTDRSTALKAEYYIKQQSKAAKELLAVGAGPVRQALHDSFGIIDANSDRR
jgi:putative endonuclease